MMKLGWTLVVAVVVMATSNELPPFANLLKRQAPGSPAFNCHQACGQAVLQVRSSEDVCGDAVFLSNYNSCLECAGPDNIDIWKYYGTALSGAAGRCGLPTTPESGNSTGTESTISAGPTSTESTQSETSSSIISTTTSTEPTTSSTPNEASTTSEASMPAASGSATTTGVVQASNAAHALPGNACKLYYAVTFGALYAIIQ
ncbi:hypothetical protein F5B18DRAFT_225932 [Nemania serpens]|nr:hypothetical protein F5B18DRAFT_225932 [Nemania serpens]